MKKSVIIINILIGLFICILVYWIIKLFEVGFAFADNRSTYLAISSVAIVIVLLQLIKTYIYKKNKK